jgi:ABC-type Zn2+ transport system substrate-binding protein/surface adhesin
MKFLITVATLSLMTGCVVEDQHRNCARNERWDGHHCMVDRAHDHHDHDRDDHDHDHDRDHHEGEGGVEVR